MIELFEEHLIDGMYHRPNGPAVIEIDEIASQWAWCLFDNSHRYYGPADEFGDWWIHGSFIK